MNKLKEWWKYNKFKLLAALFILALAATDFLTMMNYFGSAEFDVPDSDLLSFTIAFAFCLEGLPTLMGISLSNWKNKSSYKQNDKSNAVVGFWICVIGIVAAFAFVIILRFLLIKKQGGFTEFYKPITNYQQLPIDLFLMFLPILTSILAFATSWTAFKVDDEKTLEEKVEKLRNDYLKKQEAYQTGFQDLQQARSELWTLLSEYMVMPKLKLLPDNAEELYESEITAEIFVTKPKMPTILEVFKRECLMRIRAKLIEDCIATYPNQVARYNEEVENAFEKYKIQISSHTTLDEEIIDIDINEIFEAFDKSIESDKKKNTCQWNYEKAKEHLETELKQLIDNAVIVKQTKATINYPIEEA